MTRTARFAAAWAMAVAFLLAPLLSVSAGSAHAATPQVAHPVVKTLNAYWMDMKVPNAYWMDTRPAYWMD